MMAHRKKTTTYNEKKKPYHLELFCMPKTNDRMVTMTMRHTHITTVSESANVLLLYACVASVVLRVFEVFQTNKDKGAIN